jgi:small-conductance mechanosensitive channel
MDDRTLFFIVPLIVAVFVLAIWGFGYHHIQPASGMAYLVSTLLALIYIGLIVNFGLYLAEEKDEFERTVLSQAMLWGVGATMIVTSSWGVLELFNQVRHLNPVWFVPLFCLFMAAARILIKRRYR